jgi:hypothetical protein
MNIFLACAVPLLNLIPLSLAYATRSWFKKRNLVYITFALSFGSVLLGIYLVTVAVHAWIHPEMVDSVLKISMAVDLISGIVVVTSFEVVEYLEQKKGDRPKSDTR